MKTSIYGKERASARSLFVLGSANRLSPAKKASPRHAAGACSKTSQIFVFQRVDGVFLPDLARGIEHRRKHHGEHAPHRDGHAVPRDIEAARERLPDDEVDHKRHHKRRREPTRERAQAVDQALIVHHPPKALLRKPHGPEHRELAAAQGDARGDGVEHVRHRDE